EIYEKIMHLVQNSALEVAAFVIVPGDRSLEYFKLAAIGVCNYCIPFGIPLPPEVGKATKRSLINWIGIRCDLSKSDPFAEADQIERRVNEIFDECGLQNKEITFVVSSGDKKSYSNNSFFQTFNKSLKL
ncbi:MAG: hypothetical protein ACFFB3_21790, partial [Candidatus Hodarchaeota archaeon]